MKTLCTCPLGLGPHLGWCPAHPYNVRKAKEAEAERDRAADLHAELEAKAEQAADARAFRMRTLALLLVIAGLGIAGCGASPTEPTALATKPPAPANQFTACPCGETYSVPTHTCVKGIACPCGWIFDDFAGCIAPPAPTPTPTPGGKP